MKKSHIAILWVLGLFLIAILACLIVMRVAVGNGRDWTNRSIVIQSTEAYGDYRDVSYDFRSFDTVTVEGVWNLTVEQGDAFAIDVTYGPSWPEEDFVRKSGSDLVLGAPSGRIDVDEAAKATIVMPRLDTFRVEGAGTFDLRGFNQDDLDIDIEGAVQLKGHDSEIRDLVVRLEGVGQIDFEGVRSRNAEAHLSGAGEIRLMMDGGTLSGGLEGLGQIVYYGEVSNQTLSVDGLGTVKRGD